MGYSEEKIVTSIIIIMSDVGSPSDSFLVNIYSRYKKESYDEEMGPGFIWSYSFCQFPAC